LFGRRSDFARSPGAAGAAARAHRGPRQAHGARPDERERGRRELGPGARPRHPRGVVSRPGGRERDGRCAVRRVQSGRPPPGHLLSERVRPAGVRELRNGRPHLPVLPGKAALSVRLWTELHLVRLRPARYEPGHPAPRRYRHRLRRRDQYGQPGGGRGSAAVRAVPALRGDAPQARPAGLPPRDPPAGRDPHCHVPPRGARARVLGRGHPPLGSGNRAGCAGSRRLFGGYPPREDHPGRGALREGGLGPRRARALSPGTFDTTLSRLPLSKGQISNQAFMLIGLPLLAAVTLARQVAHTRPVQSADSPPPVRTVAATRAARAPVIDGRDDDPVWREAPAITEFPEWRPSEGSPPKLPTEAKIAYDAGNLYVLVRCFDPHRGTAECRIPLSHLRAGRRRQHTFGLPIDRDLYRYSQRVSWPWFRQSKAGFVSQFGEVPGSTTSRRRGGSKPRPTW